MANLSYDQAVAAILSAIVEVKEDVDAAALGEGTRLFAVKDSDEPSLELDSLGILDLLSVVERDHDVYLPDDVPLKALARVGDAARILSGAAR